MLNQIQKNRTSLPPRILIYGQEGVGKSTLGSRAVSPIFVPTEDGIDQIEVDAFPQAGKFDDVVKSLTALQSEHTYRTVVIDSLDSLERMIFDRVCESRGASSIELVDGGYGKGYTMAVNFWREIVSLLDTLRRKRAMCVLLIAHAKIEKFEDPRSATYDRYSPRLHKHGASMLVEWCDAVLFAYRRFVIKTEKMGFDQQRGIANAVGADGGERVMLCESGPSAIAKNRYGLPAEIEMSWPVLYDLLRRKKDG